MKCCAARIGHCTKLALNLDARSYWTSKKESIFFNLNLLYFIKLGSAHINKHLFVDMLIRFGGLMLTACNISHFISFITHSPAVQTPEKVKTISY